MEDKIEVSEGWHIVNKPQSSLFDFKIKEVWQYRDLLSMFIRRDVVTVYKQTVLGPIWYVVQPVLTTLIFILVFGRIAKISTDGTPMILFYLAGITMWNYFAETFNNTSKTFKENEDIFGKVYFPRLLMPLAKVIGGLIKFGIQFAMFLCFMLAMWLTGSPVNPNWSIVLLPVLLLMMAGYGLGTGIIFTSLTAKYRDLTFLLQFVVQLLMYASAVIFPVSSVPEEYRQYILLNPFVHIIEAFKYMFLGAGYITWEGLMYSFGLMVVILVFGILIFNRTEKTFMDTI
ncbi:MAG: ABC transporter permease [Imperialibacter sp.]|uniref:ABC transporter permease n=1 Tax=Imperialibacter sp. TaxID=2038411 RepID=UPI0032EE7BE7